MNTERDSTESTAAIADVDRVLEMLDVESAVGMESIEAEQNDTEVIENLVRFARGCVKELKVLVFIGLDGIAFLAIVRIAMALTLTHERLRQVCPTKERTANTIS